MINPKEYWKYIINSNRYRMTLIKTYWKDDEYRMISLLANLRNINEISFHNLYKHLKTAPIASLSVGTK